MELVAQPKDFFEQTPHPVIPMLTDQECVAILEKFGEEKLKEVLRRREDVIEAEETDCYRHGHRPPVWHLADDLLTDGHEVILDDYFPAAEVPKDFDNELIRRGYEKIITKGGRELWILGGNRTSKTEYAAWKFVASASRSGGRDR